MDKNEIICLSSDDENKCQSSEMKNVNKSPQKPNLKVDKEICKKRKHSDVVQSLQPIKKLKPITVSDCKPKLIIKEKVSISHEDTDTFPMFISLCLQRERSDDMVKIVNKLKRRYEQLDTEYKHSQEFVELLNENRHNISSDGVKLFAYIRKVMDVMKSNRCKSNSNRIEVPKSKKEVEEVKEGEEAEEEEEGEEEEEENSEEKRKLEKIQLIESTMRKCEMRIQKLEESEVDFEEDVDSTYMRVCKYKTRMIELYSKYCELTGDNADAGRAYLRPKHVNSTGIVTVDQAITSFINAKISKRNRMKKCDRFVDNLVFPDYHDILNCIRVCNEDNELGLEMKKQEQMAKAAFIKLGEFLQRMRRNDYWDTFSMFLENKEDDPALKDPILEQKLKNNLLLGKRNLTEEFDKYSRKQESKEHISDSENSTDELEDSNEDESLDDENEQISEEEEAKEQVTTDVNVNSKVAENPKIETKNDENQSKRETLAVNNSLNLSNGFVIRDKSPRVSNEKVKTQPEKSIEKPPSTMVTCISTANNGDIEVELAEEVIDLEDDDDKEKSFLRVCSFAKPPTTWEDGRQKSEKQSNLSAKIVIKTKSSSPVIDLTNEQLKNIAPNTPIAKTLPKVCKLKSVPVPMKKVLIPNNISRKNIINVKHVTNNFVKLSDSLSTQASGTTVKINSVTTPVRQINVKKPTYVYLKTGGNNQTITTTTNNKIPEKQTTVTNFGTTSKPTTSLITKSPQKVVLSKEFMSKATFIPKFAFLQKNCTLVKRNGVPIILQKKVDYQNHVVSSTSDIASSSKS